MFLEELLPRSYKQIIQQIDNLRSNNSKEALNLVSEIFEHQEISKISGEIMGPVLNAVFTKTVSEKGFLKREAKKAVGFLTRKYNPCLVEELSSFTQSHHSSISEEAIRILCEYLEFNKVSEFSPGFYRILSINLDGKRAVLQKRAKEIIQNLKNRIGSNLIIQENRIL